MAGRPKKPEGEVRENILRIRLTPAERSILDRAAQARGEDTSTWARSVLLSLVGRKGRKGGPGGN
jgi:hypothetical protein